MVSSPQPEGGNGINLLLAIKETALVEAGRLDADATAWETKAAELRHQAKGLREIHAAAGPYLPTPVTPLRVAG
jgi:hypothetical protein